MATNWAGRRVLGRHASGKTAEGPWRACISFAASFPFSINLSSTSVVAFISAWSSSDKTGFFPTGYASAISLELRREGWPLPVLLAVLLASLLPPGDGPFEPVLAGAAFGAIEVVAMKIGYVLD